MLITYLVPDIRDIIINKRSYVTRIDSLTGERILTSSQDLQCSAVGTVTEKQRGPQRHREEPCDLTHGVRESFLEE